MAENLGDLAGSTMAGGKDVLMVFGIIIVVVLISLIILGIAFWVFFYKKKWNLKVEFKLPRSDGKIINGEWGKGYFNAGRGVCYLKRKGHKAVPMKIFDVKRYLQGSDLLTVIQVGPEDYRPVLNDSWTEVEEEYEDDETGEIKIVKESILNIKIDSGLNKAWKSAWDAAAKKAYSLQSFFNQFQTPIAVGIVILCCFVGFAILWTRLG